MDILLPFPRVRAWMACIEAECRCEGSHFFVQLTQR